MHTNNAFGMEFFTKMGEAANGTYRRQYRAFEDRSEPCALTLTPTAIVVTYQMKSIICEHRFASIKHLKTDRLSRSTVDLSSSNAHPHHQPHHHHRQPHVNLRANILKIRFHDDFAGRAPKCKEYRFDSRAILDEFLAQAIRARSIERVVERTMLLGRKIKYIPIFDEAFNNLLTRTGNKSNSNNNNNIYNYTFSNNNNSKKKQTGISQNSRITKTLSTIHY